jgi:hypothetical protein
MENTFPLTRNTVLYVFKTAPNSGEGFLISTHGLSWGDFWLWNHNLLMVLKARGERRGAPLTLADVFLGLGSGFGGAGFCRDQLNYTNTANNSHWHQKEHKRTIKDDIRFDYGFVHFEDYLFLFLAVGNSIKTLAFHNCFHPGFPSEWQVRSKSRLISPWSRIAPRE